MSIYVCSAISNCPGILSLNFYPEIGDVLPGQLRIAEHTDIDMFTIVAQDSSIGGLEILIRDKDAQSWIPVPLVEDALIVNIGDCVSYWTNNYWRSTRHKVALPPSLVCGHESRRHSLAFFITPNFNAPIDVIVPGENVDEPTTLLAASTTFSNWRKARISQAMRALKQKPVSGELNG